MLSLLTRVSQSSPDDKPGTGDAGTPALRGAAGRKR